CCGLRYDADAWSACVMRGLGRRNCAWRAHWAQQSDELMQWVSNAMLLTVCRMVGRMRPTIRQTVSNIALLTHCINSSLC
ncbi:hypothetical protein, partial [Xanthomonas oryzae]|uniref:hypothetical protein n=1 Tax=Xanthomonas oryzae TaxID=347 RepID=UPI001C49CD7D